MLYSYLILKYCEYSSYQCIYENLLAVVCLCCVGEMLCLFPYIDEKYYKDNRLVQTGWVYQPSPIQNHVL